VIVIAHRLSTIRSADRIVVLRSGRVVEEGSPGDLIAAEGEFSWLSEGADSPDAAVANGGESA
jgi:ATP-binding cassette subfamily B protein